MKLNMRNEGHAIVVVDGRKPSLCLGKDAVLACRQSTASVPRAFPKEDKKEIILFIFFFSNLITLLQVSQNSRHFKLGGTNLPTPLVLLAVGHFLNQR